MWTGWPPSPCRQGSSGSCFRRTAVGLSAAECLLMLVVSSPRRRARAGSKGWSAHAIGGHHPAVRQLVRYGRAVIGRPIAIPADVGLWHPPVVALRELIRLHAAVMPVAETHPGKTMGRETARGLEQELIAGLIECLSDEAVAADTAVRHADIMTRSEGDCRVPERIPSMADVCAALNVPERTLRQCPRAAGNEPEAISMVSSHAGGSCRLEKRRSRGGDRRGAGAATRFHGSRSLRGFL